MNNSLQIVNTNREMQEWADKIKACRSSNLSVRAWCRENNVPISSFYFWQKKIFNRVSGRESSFVEVIKSCFINLEISHIKYVLLIMKENTTYIRIIKKYMPEEVYNALATIISCYTSLINYNLYGVY